MGARGRPEPDASGAKPTTLIEVFEIQEEKPALMRFIETVGTNVETTIKHVGTVGTVETVRRDLNMFISYSFYSSCSFYNYHNSFYTGFYYGSYNYYTVSRCVWYSIASFSIAPYNIQDILTYVCGCLCVEVCASQAHYDT